MMIDEVIDVLWQSMQKGSLPPQALYGKLSLADAYRVQLAILARRVAAGEKLAGWKIGLTADAVRNMFGVRAPVCGYLLADRQFTSGHSFPNEAFGKPILESELCFTMGETLTGPGVTRGRALAAIAAVAPAFEIADLRTDMAADLPLGVADNVAQWGYVTGPALSPYPANLDLGELTAEMRKNGTVVAQVRGREVIDNQIESIAWLANHLAEYGVALEAGQCIMTGSWTKPLPITKGEQWETHFSSVGMVTASF